MRFIPSTLMCLSTCSGISLRPELLFALKACCSVYLSSSGVICCVVGSVTGMYSSSGRFGLWKIVRLCSVNSYNFNADMSSSLDFSMLQNYLGLYFSISGSRIYSFARLRAQHCRYYLYACCAGILDLPYVCLFCVQSYFAFLQS
jgi:hypothetical protein